MDDILTKDPETQRKWLIDICRDNEIPLTTLAKKADLAPSTITRFANGGLPSDAALSLRTVRKIERAFGVPYDLDSPTVRDIYMAGVVSGLVANSTEDYPPVEATEIAHQYVDAMLRKRGSHV